MPVLLPVPFFGILRREGTLEKGLIFQTRFLNALSFSSLVQETSLCSLLKKNLGALEEPLKVSQLIMLSLVALITGEAQRFVLMRKAFEHSQVQELLIANMDPKGQKKWTVSSTE